MQIAVFLLWLHMTKRKRRSCFVTLWRDLTPCITCYPHDLIISQSPNLQMLSQWVLGLQQMNLVRGVFNLYTEYKYSVNSRSFRHHLVLIFFSAKRLNQSGRSHSMLLVTPLGIECLFADSRASVLSFLPHNLIVPSAQRY